MKPRPITSASNLHRRAACPGSANAEKDLAEQDSEDSREGQLLHRLFFSKTNRTALVTADQLEVVETAERYTRKFITEFTELNSIPIDAQKIEAKEVELSAGAVTGHADLIIEWPDCDCAVVIDAKFGRLEVEEAADNLQLAAYATALNDGILVSQYGRLDIEEEETPSKRVIGVAIVQPRAFGERITSAIYRGPSLTAARAELVRIVHATKNPDAPRHAGEHCRYCKAKVTCKEYLESLNQLAVMPDKTAVATLSDEYLRNLFLAIKRANQIKDEVEAEIRARMDAGKAVGLALKYRNTGSVRELFQPLGALEAMNVWLDDNGYAPLSATAFDSCRRMQFGELEKLFANLTGLAQTRAKERLKEILAEYTVERPKRAAIIEA